MSNSDQDKMQNSNKNKMQNSDKGKMQKPAKNQLQEYLHKAGYECYPHYDTTKKYPFRSVVSIRKSVDDSAFCYRSDGEFESKKQAEASAATIALKCLNDKTKGFPEETLFIVLEKDDKKTTFDPKLLTNDPHYIYLQDEKYLCRISDPHPNSQFYIPLKYTTLDESGQCYYSPPLSPTYV